MSTSGQTPNTLKPVLFILFRSQPIVFTRNKHLHLYNKKKVLAISQKAVIWGPSRLLEEVSSKLLVPLLKRLCCISLPTELQFVTAHRADPPKLSSPIHNGRSNKYIRINSKTHLCCKCSGLEKRKHRAFIYLLKRPQVKWKM